ncbi:hypothetical protein FJ364_01990 [Candidatus Dependentiae bacterium]|nr:hypothetical protein [Candidatus Dependentiae bacterium]
MCKSLKLFFILIMSMHISLPCTAAAGNLNPTSLAVQTKNFMSQFEHEDLEFKALCDKFSADFNNALLPKENIPAESAILAEDSNIFTLDSFPNEVNSTQQELAELIDTQNVIKLIHAALSTFSYKKEQMLTLEGQHLPSLKMLVQCFRHNDESQFQLWLTKALANTFPELDEEQCKIIIHFLKNNTPISSLQISEILQFTTHTASKRCRKWIDSKFFATPMSAQSKRRYYLSDEILHRLNNFPTELLREGLFICIQ